MSYKKEWTAECPGCGNHLTHADFVCKNCGNRKIKVSVHVVSGVRSVYFGCENDNCATPAPFDVKCKCGASIQATTAKTAGCFIASAIFGYDSTVTQLLRHFSDTVLIKSSWGRAFVFWYYENSKALLKRMGREPD